MEGRRKRRGRFSGRTMAHTQPVAVVDARATIFGHQATHMKEARYTYATGERVNERASERVSEEATARQSGHAQDSQA